MSRSSLLTVGILALVAASPVSAQNRGGGGGNSGSSFGGSSGGSGFGGSGSNNSGGDVSAGFGGNSQSGFGDTSSFGQSNGLSALSSGIGTSATGMGASSGGTLNSGSSSSRNGSSRSSSGGSSNRNGRSSTSGRNSVTGMTNQRSPGRNGMSGMNGMNGMAGMNGMGRNNRISPRGIGVQQAIRPVIQIALDLPTSLQTTAVAQAANASFAQNQLLSNSMQGVQVNVDSSGVATVRGNATSNRDRTMAAALLSLEPGVRAVKNEIAVPPIASTPSNR